MLKVIQIKPNQVDYIHRNGQCCVCNKQFTVRDIYTIKHYRVPFFSLCCMKCKGKEMKQVYQVVYE